MITEKVKADIASLTLEEKCWLLAEKNVSYGDTYGDIPSLNRVGIAPKDNPRGGEDYFRSGYGINDGKYHPAAFPVMSCLAMSWDTELAEETGRITGREALANPEGKATWILRPGVNIKRSPLCGRNFEYFSEDPICAGELSGSYIKGLQSTGVAATLKHFLCNNQEFERMTTNSVVDNRTIHEIYLKNFEIAIKKGDPWSIMTSYNRVNGEWVNSNPQVMKMLREELGYDGVVVSDFGAIHENKVAAHRNGMDAELAPACIHSQQLIDAVKNGEISEDQIDEELGRILTLCDRLYEAPECEVDLDALHIEAQKAAEQCLVLLKNDGVLPVAPDTQQRLLVVGNLAVNPSTCGGGSGHMNGYLIDKPLDEIRRIAESDVDFAAGYETNGGWPPVDVINEELTEEAVSKAADADVVFFFAGLEYCYESEGYDRKDILLPESQRILLDRLLDLDCRVVIILSCGSVVDLSSYNDRAAAVVYSGLAGEGFGCALARILFGQAEPGGRLSETFPMRLEDTPAYLSFTHNCMDGVDVNYGEGVFVGYRWYDKKNLPVLYPFGHGLSYTTFSFSDLEIDRKTFTADESVQVSLKVKNTGEREGSEVVQLYVGDPECIVERPVKELKAFQKVRLNPGEETTVTFTLGKDAFSFFSPRLEKWVAEAGTFEIMIGNSSRSILLSDTVELTKGDTVMVYDEMTPLDWFVHSEKFMNLIKTEFPEKAPMFDQESFDWLCLVLPLPFYKMAQPLMGTAMLSEEEVQYILKRMNEPE